MEELSRIRSEVNEHKLRLHTVEVLIDQYNKTQTDQNNSIKELTKSISKLEKRFTLFIAALIVSVGFGDGITELLLKLILS